MEGCERVRVNESAWFDNNIGIEKWYDKQRFATIHHLFCRYGWLCLPAAAAYLVMIVVLRNYMDSRKAYGLKNALLAWNIFLAAFSALGTVRVFDEWYSILFVEENGGGLAASVCDSRCFTGGGGFWLMLFTFSKLLEFGDTVFVLLRKQKLIFLHWYHHAATMVYCFMSFAFILGFSRWFSLMNLFVHTIMYSYYALKALKVPVSRVASMLLTALQLTQMFVGTALVLLAWTVKSQGIRPCPIPNKILYASLLMYFSYVILFADFFRNAYLIKSSKAKPRALDNNNIDKNK